MDNNQSPATDSNQQNQSQNQSQDPNPEQNKKSEIGILPSDLVNRLIGDAAVRIAAVTKSFYLFFHFYFAHYITFRTAEFQKQIFHLIERSDKEDLYIVAFRGSGKSTLMTTVYPIWAILGRQQKKFVVIFCQTKQQARQQMANLKSELESNELLKNDLGPFSEEADEWGLTSLVFKNSGARILGTSVDSSVRGVRHNQWRPDLLILDDCENVASTKTYESRQQLEEWFRREVIPLGDPTRTRIVVVGNLLHEDSLMMRIKRDIDEKKRSGTFKMYPIIDENDRIAWPGKYPDMDAIARERERVGFIDFEREYNLRIISDEDQIIPSEWIHGYDDLPQSEQPIQILMGVDLAISQKKTADKTAIVSAAIYGYGKDARIYFLPHAVNKKIDFTTTLERIRNIFQTNMSLCTNVKILVEQVAYQQAAIEMLEKEGLPVEGFKVTDDKRARLMTVSNLIKNGQALFSSNGCDEQVRQIVGFGVERYDDVLDATVMVLLQFLKEPPFIPKIYWLDLGGGGGGHGGGPNLNDIMRMGLH